MYNQPPRPAGARSQPLDLLEGKRGPRRRLVGGGEASDPEEPRWSTATSSGHAHHVIRSTNTNTSDSLVSDDTLAMAMVLRRLAEQGETTTEAASSRKLKTDGEASRYYKLESMLQDQSAKPCDLPLQYLKDITNDFSGVQELGRGGFGVVYKGVLQNGKVIAVKRLKLTSGVEYKQFKNEVEHLMILKHQNIVRFIGYCYEIRQVYVDCIGKNDFAGVEEMLLCFEYLPKGSLERHLSDESCGLDWHRRYKIIEGICYGLYYLHEERKINTPIIHLDLKPANILLDDNMIPKIADFGLARLFTQQQSQIHTETLKGTFGYMAPEYLHKGIITTKSDIFSLGVIILEIMTGHKDYPDSTGMFSEDFVELVSTFKIKVLKNWRNRLEATPSYSREIDFRQIKVCIQIGLNCVETDPKKRPAIKEIIENLNRWQSMDFHDSNDERSLEDQVLAMSMEDANSGAAAAADAAMSKITADGQNLTLDLQMSVQDENMSDLSNMREVFEDKKFVISILNSLPGVDQNDPSVEELFASLHV